MMMTSPINTRGIDEIKEIDIINNMITLETAPVVLTAYNLVIKAYEETTSMFYMFRLHDRIFDAPQNVNETPNVNYASTKTKIFNAIKNASEYIKEHINEIMSMDGNISDIANEIRFAYAKNALFKSICVEFIEYMNHEIASYEIINNEEPYLSVDWEWYFSELSKKLINFIALVNNSSSESL